MTVRTEKNPALAELKLEFSSPEKGNSIPSLDQRVEQAALVLKNLMTDQSEPQRNPAYEILKVGILTEKNYHEKIQKGVQQANDLQNKMELLINLSGKLSVDPKETKGLSLPKDIRPLIDDLKKQGISLFNDGEEYVSLERLAEVKSQINSHVEQAKTKLQTLFTTQIQVNINEISSIMECLKTILKSWERLISSIINHSTPR